MPRRKGGSRQPPAPSSFQASAESFPSLSGGPSAARTTAPKPAPAVAAAVAAVAAAPAAASAPAWGASTPAAVTAGPAVAVATASAAGGAAGATRAPAPKPSNAVPRLPFEVRGTKKGGLPVAVEKRSKGKVVTVLSNLSGDLKELCSLLKRALGSGGAIRGGQVQSACMLAATHRVQQPVRPLADPLPAHLCVYVCVFLCMCVWVCMYVSCILGR